MKIVKKFSYIIILAVILTLLVPFPASIEASPVKIYVPDDYPTIQAAVDSASPGDKIIVRDGTYTEDVIVNKAHLIIQSENGSESTIIQPASLGASAIYINSEYVTISGFTLTGAFGYISPQGYGAGILARYADHLTIVNNHIFNNEGRGIRIMGSDKAVIKDNHIHNNGGDGITISGENSIEHKIYNNILETNAGRGIQALYILNSEIFDNVVESNGYMGIHLIYSNNNTITNNYIISNYSAGMYLPYSSNNLIYLNSFQDDEAVMYQSSNIWHSPGEKTYIYNNRVRTSYLGNYWSDYMGSDADGDGTGDTSFFIRDWYDNSTDSDDYPLVNSLQNYRIIPNTNKPAQVVSPPFRGKWIQKQKFAAYLYEYDNKIYDGYHSGEDWVFKGNTSKANIYSISSGEIMMISPLGQLGYLIAIEHTGLFTIPGEIAVVNGETYQYPTENVTRIYSIYVHVIPKPGLKIGDHVRTRERIATLANINHPHLHFEIRHTNQIPSGNWSLVQPQSNWQVFPGTNQYNGYYKNVQQMVDSGLRNPSRFLEEN